MVAAGGEGEGLEGESSQRGDGDGEATTTTGTGRRSCRRSARATPSRSTFFCLCVSYKARLMRRVMSAPRVYLYRRLAGQSGSEFHVALTKLDLSPKKNWFD